MVPGSGVSPPGVLAPPRDSNVALVFPSSFSSSGECSHSWLAPRVIRGTGGLGKPPREERVPLCEEQQGGSVWGTHRPGRGRLGPHEPRARAQWWAGFA